MRQEEGLKIVDPLTVYLTHKGWYVKKMHGNQFQEGVPDLLISHPNYTMRFVECKISGRPFTRSQIIEFPKMILHGIGIWLIEGVDFRGEKGKPELLRAYSKLFQPANCAYYLLPENRRLKI
jgi:hypothetical protein